MSLNSDMPNEKIAGSIVEQIKKEDVLSVERMTTGEQFYVYAVDTSKDKYVIRLADLRQKSYFLSAMYWQKKLIPIGVPLAPFIASDLDGEYSQFPALLMNRLPGSDLCNVYDALTNDEKKKIAQQIVQIQKRMDALPDGLGFGYAANYEEQPAYQSWYDFLLDHIDFYIKSINELKIFSSVKLDRIYSQLLSNKNLFERIPPRPFLYDTSERNVIVHQGGISGIVDVDDICFGDPLLVIGLTHIALLLESHDPLYCEYWVQELGLAHDAIQRLEFYKSFYILHFMRKYKKDFPKQLLSFL